MNHAIVQIFLSWLNYINTVFEVFCLFYMLTENLKAERRPSVRRFHSNLLISAAALAAGGGCRYLLNQRDFPFPGLIGFYMIFGILFSLIMFRRGFFSYSLLTMIYSTLVMLLRHIVGIFFSLYLQPLMNADQGISLQIFTLILIFVMAKLMIAGYKNAPNTISFSYWAFFMLLFLCIYYIFGQIETELGENSLLLFILIIIAILVSGIFFQLLQIASNYEKKLRYQLLSKELAMSKAHVEDVENLYGNLRRLRHELKNIIFYMQTLLDDKDYGQLEQYFTEFHQKYEYLYSFIDTGNQTLNTILNSRLAEVRQKGIPAEVIATAPDTLSIEPSELFSLLSNMLDNAVEGMSVRQPGLSISIGPEKGYLSIEVKNRVDTDVLKENPTLSTTKPDASFHGYGIKTMEEITSHYDGWIDFSVKDGWFSAHARILISNK